MRRTWLIKLRESKGYSQTNIADITRISVQHYHLIEKGKKNPSGILALRIADFLGFDMRQFYEDMISEEDNFKMKQVNKREA